MNREIAVIGLGYVGLPVATAFGKAGFHVTGYDVDKSRILELKKGWDRTGECATEDLQASHILFTTDAKALRECNFLIVTIPTPIDEANRPDLFHLKSAAQTVGENLSKGSIVVIESTVYPGVTEGICLPIFEKASGLHAGSDFHIAYCPERINPGDKKHTLEKVVKVVSGMNSETLEEVAEVYGTICKAGVWKAPTIKTAEAAKVIENIQRDLNIALMNELSILFNKLGIVTKDVLDAAATKWNFHKYTPGLVGGHCIGVDPYYLTYLAETLGHHPELILAGRRLNDSMGDYVADQILLGLVKTGKIVNQSKVLILGVTFKENVPDTRNSKVFQVIEGLRKFGVTLSACDPFVKHEEILSKFGVTPARWPLDSVRYDAVFIAVPHEEFKKKLTPQALENFLNLPASVLDLKWTFRKEEFSGSILYQAL